MSCESYRKMLSSLRAYIRIIENNLREKDYSFEYNMQPSKALFKYRKAFIRNDGERYQKFITDARENPYELNTSTLTPYDIVGTVIKNRNGMSSEERAVLDTTWNALENYVNSDNTLVVVDGSGSMYWGGASVMPAAVAESLGIYFAERNKGAFRNHFITFSANPQLVEIKGEDIFEKVQYCMSFNECSNTNIADMTNFKNAKAKFERAGYKLPSLVFWNVNSFNRQQPVRMNEKGVTLVSGMSPQIFAMLKSDNMDPYSFMMSVISSERYKQVAA